MAQLSSAVNYSFCFPATADMLPLPSSSISRTSLSRIYLVETSYTFSNDTPLPLRIAVHVEQASPVKNEDDIQNGRQPGGGSEFRLLGGLINF